MMRTTGVVIAAVMIVGLVAAAAIALAQGGDKPAPLPGPDRPRIGPGPGGPGRDPGTRPGRGLPLRRGYIEPTPESKRLWDRLGHLQADLHRLQWKYFEIVSKQPVDKDALREVLKQMVQVRKEMRQVQQELRQYWRPFPPGVGPGPGRGRGRGPGRGHGGGQGGVGNLPPPAPPQG